MATEASIRLARVHTDDRLINQLQSNVAKLLEPVASNQIVNGQILTSVALVAGDNSINHGLNRALVGWYFTRVRAAATVFDKQDTNTTPTLTLVLNASAPVTVDIAVF